MRWSPDGCSEGIPWVPIHEADEILATFVLALVLAIVRRRR
jgi:hypothetical protein